MIRLRHRSGCPCRHGYTRMWCTCGAWQERLEALLTLRDSRQLTTALLEPLGLPLESFLQFAQKSKSFQERAIDSLLEELPEAFSY